MSTVPRSHIINRIILPTWRVAGAMPSCPLGNYCSFVCRPPYWIRKHTTPLINIAVRGSFSLERLLVVQLIGFGDLKSLLGGIQDRLDLLDEAIFLLLELGVLINSLLDEQFNVAQLAEVEVALALQSNDGLLQCVVLGLESGTGSTAASLGNARTAGRGSCSTWTSGTGTAGGTRSSAASGDRRTLSPGDGVVVTAGVVLVPKLLCPLQEIEVVLHLALHQGFDRDGLLDLMLCEGIWRGIQSDRAG